MKVHELIEQLKGYPHNMEILVASDEEANNINEIWISEEFSNEFGEICAEEDFYPDDYKEKVLVIYP